MSILNMFALQVPKGTGYNRVNFAGPPNDITIGATRCDPTTIGHRIVS